MNLTPRHRELLVLLAQGYAVKEAAAKLGISQAAAHRRLEEARLHNGRCSTTLQLMWRYGLHTADLERAADL